MILIKSILLRQSPLELLSVADVNKYRDSGPGIISILPGLREPWEREDRKRIRAGGDGGLK